jgi:catalase
VATPEEAVDALNGVFGRHSGFRAAHAKGTLCRGTFTPSSDAADITTAAHMQGTPVDVTVRFSNASGDPAALDRANARGMAVKFHLADGSSTDIVSVTLRRFIVRTPEEFVELNRALKPNPRGGQPDFRALKLSWFVLRHPRHLKALREAGEVKAVASYAHCRYNALHAFRWIDRSGAGRYVRYSWVPEQPGGDRSDSDAKRLDRDYLQHELAARLDRTPVRFGLQLQLGEGGDSVTDPMSAWPKDRKVVRAGTLELTEIAAEEALLVFDPTRVTDGIELSDDPILRFRPRAYGVSVERRTH